LGESLDSLDKNPGTSLDHNRLSELRNQKSRKCALFQKKTAEICTRREKEEGSNVKDLVVNQG
jgi:hypothetical protein